MAEEADDARLSEARDPLVQVDVVEDVGEVGEVVLAASCCEVWTAHESCNENLVAHFLLLKERDEGAGSESDGQCASSKVGNDRTHRSSAVKFWAVKSVSLYASRPYPKRVYSMCSICSTRFWRWYDQSTTA